MVYNERYFTNARAALIAGVAASALAASVGGIIPVAEAASPTSSSLQKAEDAVAEKLADNHSTPTANGILTYVVTSKNPYTGQNETTRLSERNPLIYRIDGNKSVKPDKNRLTSGKFAFGYIDVMSKQPKTYFIEFDPDSMRFKPAKQGHQVRWVKFPNMYVGGANTPTLNYGHPLNPDGKPYKNELFGISAPEGTHPKPIPPQM